jgi:hypothetical protein
MAKKAKRGYIAVTSHSSTHDKHVAYRPTYDECLDIVHNFFLSYDFEIKDGKPFDGGHGDEGFDCFDSVEIHNGKVAGFMHCGGDGPVAYITESE